ncbi:hypothetical protein PIB30_090253 [Stylosanthes scabra]|uniref:Uncharacterized protein n=1 Tax=Stylosanthes scabra TaxID=79078 RepID=A0ABU6ZSW7_9FABA|nr:hypothetical protein [Stylosanthes scabra]
MRTHYLAYVYVSALLCVPPKFGGRVRIELQVVCTYAGGVEDQEPFPVVYSLYSLLVFRAQKALENEEKRAKRLKKLAEEIIEQNRVTFGPRSKHDPLKDKLIKPQATAIHVWTTPQRGPNVAQQDHNPSSPKHHKQRLDHASTWAKRGPSKTPKLSLTLSPSRLDHASTWAKRDLRRAPKAQQVPQGHVWTMPRCGPNVAHASSPKPS